MKIKTALLATALAVSAAPMASAQFLGTPGDGVVPRSRVEQMQGFYGSLGGGVNWLQSTMVKEPGENEVEGRLHFHSGWDVNGAIGYAFGIGPRIELEGAFRSNNFAFMEDFGAIDHVWGHAKQASLMLNVAYDIYTGTRLVPYLGFGGGVVRSRMHGEVNCDGCSDFVKDHTWTWAAQGFGGLDFLVTQALRLGVRYTFLHTPILTNLDNLEAKGDHSERFQIDPNSHAITVQAMYNFGAPRQIPAPPPAPVQAPAPLQRNFLVFFDFDKSDITPEADRVIVQAANNAKTASVTRITLTGHTDRAGPVAYNQRLSERRADAVKARLVREGIPAASIVTIGRGESQPLVPTADGVREPQNRRVEIVL